MANSMTIGRVTRLQNLYFPRANSYFKHIRPVRRRITNRIQAFFRNRLVETRVTQTLTISNRSFVNRRTRIILHMNVASTMARTTLIINTGIQRTRTNTPGVSTHNLKLATHTNRRARHCRHAYGTRPNWLPIGGRTHS